MLISIISDFHGNLNFAVEESNLLLIAGDICPAYRNFLTSIDMQEDWLNCEFRKWLKKQPVKNVVICPGNHDWIFEKDINRVPNLGNNVHCLIDERTELLGLKIYGTPWQLPFCDWAFNLREEGLKLCWEKIPEDTDILLCHGPPYNIMDIEGRDNSHIGSISLSNRIKNIKPKIVAFGHNHNEHGVVEHDGITYVNASLVDESYNMNREPIVLDID